MKRGWLQLTMDRGFFESGYRRCLSSYKTSYRRLFSLGAGSCVFVLHLFVTVYYILCNTVYYVLSQANGFPCILWPFSPSFWALSRKIAYVSGKILSQNVKFVMISLMISACTKTRNSKTKGPKRNKRNDQNKTTFMTKTKPLQRSSGVEDAMSYKM